MQKRVLNVLALSIRLAHGVFERNSKLHHWSNSDTLKEYNKSIKKTKKPVFRAQICVFLAQICVFLAQICDNRLSIWCARCCCCAFAAILPSSFGLIGLNWNSIKANTSFEFESSFEDFVRKKYPPQWVSWAQHQEQRPGRGRGGGHERRAQQGKQRYTARRQGKQWGQHSSTAGHRQLAPAQAQQQHKRTHSSGGSSRVGTIRRIYTRNVCIRVPYRESKKECISLPKG